MTFKELLILLQDMERTQHTSLDKTVMYDDGESMVCVDIVESLSGGDAYLTKQVDLTTEEDDVD